MVQFGLNRDLAPPPVQASKEPIIRFFSYHDAHPVALGMVLIGTFGVECLEWDSEALKLEILDHFNATSVSDSNWQKIQAFRTMMLVSSPWTEWEVFEKIIQAVNNNTPDPRLVQKCSPAQLMAGVDIMNAIREEPFSEEVHGYIAACAVEAGVTYLPEGLSMAQEALSQPHYRCKDCGNVDPLTQSDMRCDVCCERFCHDRPLSMRPNPDLDKDIGTNIETFNIREPHLVQKRYEEIKNKLEVDIDEANEVDVQAAKLAVAFKYMTLRRQQLADQLSELKPWLKT